MNDRADDGLLCAWLLDGKGGGQVLDWGGIRRWQPDDGPIWVHLDRGAESTRQWLIEGAGLSDLLAASLMADETRPRVRESAEGIVLILRGVNLNPGAEPDDMVQLRLFTDGRRVISLRQRRVYAIQDLQDQFAKGIGPRGAGEVIVRLADLMGFRIGQVVDQVEDNIDDLEESVLTESAEEMRSRLAEMRHQAIMLRRYIGPQRDALHELSRLAPSWLNERERRQLDEVAERTMRLREDLDAARERASVIQDELANRLNERLNRNMYRLSVIAAVFLPLGLLTGLLGINVGGMPGVDSGLAFWVVCALLVVVGLGQYLLFRRWKWF